MSLPCVGVQKCFAQNFADKEYYLVDSLVLEDLSEDDWLLLDSCLEVYHKNEGDTIGINSIALIVQ